MSENYTLTPTLGLFKPNYRKDSGKWGEHWNANADKLDAAIADVIAGGGGGGGGGTSDADITAYFAALPTSDVGVAPGGMFWNGGFLNRVAGGVGGTFISNADIEAYFAALPTSDAGLPTGGMFWNGGFLCRKI